MNFPALEFVLQMGFAFAVFLSTVSRLGKTNEETIDEIRHSIWYVSVTALFLLVAPFLPLIEPCLFIWEPMMTPHWLWIAFLFGVTVLQWSTARHWGKGTPWSYIKQEHRRERRTTKETQWPNYSHTL